MPPSIIAILILGLLFVLLAGGLPLGFAMGLSGFLGTLLLIDVDASLALLGQTAYETSLAYNLSVIPLFVLMGYIAGEAGLNESLYRACNAWLGHRRGGLALATIGACGAFAAICGSSLATAATMAQIALPEMRKYKYDDRLATGAVAAGGTIGILIPPSVVMVIYGLLTETSISALFLAGFIPGFLTVLGFMATISIVCRIDPKLGPPAARTAMPDRFKALGSVWGTALLFLVVIGGLYVGWFSPTEAASVGCGGAFVLGLVNRKTPRQLLGTSLIDTVKTTAMIFGRRVLGHGDLGGVAFEIEGGVHRHRAFAVLRQQPPAEGEENHADDGDARPDRGVVEHVERLAQDLLAHPRHDDVGRGAY
jgi:tripartite ATP-independent transporter DctM subunit